MRQTLGEPRKVAWITGVTGQDGAYLALYLLGLGYFVVGMVKRVSGELDAVARMNLPELGPYLASGQFVLEQGDLLDFASMVKILAKHQPDEIYNLAALSHVGDSEKAKEIYNRTNAMGVDSLLDAVRLVIDLGQMKPEGVRIYQASTSELFGYMAETISPQNEDTPMKPRSPYARSKHYAFSAMVEARRPSKGYPLFAVNGILFNHESERRGHDFVTRKVTIAAARIKLGEQEVLEMGNMNARRDWGYAPNYVEAMHLMLQQSEPKDYVIATGIQHTIRYLVETAFRAADIEGEYVWVNQGTPEERLEVGGVTRVVVNPDFLRGSDLAELHGDPTRAKTELGWEPTITFEQMIQKMVANDLELVARGRLR